MLSHNDNSTSNAIDHSFRDEISAILSTDSTDSSGATDSLQPETYTSPTSYLTPIQTADFQQTIDSLAEDVSKVRERKGSHIGLGGQVDEVQKTQAQKSRAIEDLHAQIKAATAKSESIKSQSEEVTRERDRVGRSVRNLEFTIQDYEEKKKEAAKLLSQAEKDVQEAEKKLGRKLERETYGNKATLYAAVGAMVISLVLVLSDLRSALGWWVTQI